MSNDSLIVGVAGAGAMGSGIAQVAAANGHKTILFDISKTVLENAEKKLQANLDKLVQKNQIANTDAIHIKNRISYASSLEAFKECGIVIEAIAENIEIKQKLFVELEKFVTPECILTSNTSSLSITSIAGACNENSRVIGIHFFNPAPIMPLVEIIPGLVTAEKTIIAVKKLIDSWGKTTVVAKDTPGFIVNRIARPFYGEAIRIYEEGIASIQTIDNAMKEIGNFRMGPFELMDFIGNDINYAVSETVWQQMFFDARYKPSITQKRLVEAKWLGRKTGRGYYYYAEGKIVSDDKIETNKQTQLYIFNRIICMLINEAFDALYLGIASRTDIEVAMTKGVNYPKGLLNWADELGLVNVLAILQGLQNEYGEERYRPSLLLKKMASENKNLK